MISVTKIFRFEAAHRISNYDGACKQIHGHSYELHVSVTGEPRVETDMIMDFKILKKITEEHVISKLDHALILKSGEEHEAIGNAYKTYYLPVEPTAERLLLCITESLIHALPEGIRLTRLKLFETAGSYAEWEPDKKG